jgi:hypothetical protein
LHLAKVTLRARHSASGVAVFDGSILATAAVSAPEVMIKSAAGVLNGFDETTIGRSLSRPRHIAELCLAFEVQRHLM